MSAEEVAVSILKLGTATIEKQQADIEKLRQQNEILKRAVEKIELWTSIDPDEAHRCIQDVHDIALKALADCEKVK